MSSSSVEAHRQLAAAAADAVTVAPGAPIGELLRATIAALRTQLADATAPIAVLSPSSANGTLLRQQLARAGSFVRVEFFTPEHLVHTLGRASLIDDPRHIEPPGWLSATLGHLLATLDAEQAPARREASSTIDAEQAPARREASSTIDAAQAPARREASSTIHAALAGYRDTLVEPGWRAALEQAVQRLEEGRVTPDALRAVLDRAPRPRRLALLATLLEGVATARTRDALLGPVELQQAAKLGERPPIHHGLERIAAAVVVGDRTLSPTVAEALLDWCARRPVVRLALAPLEQLPPAPLGLREVTQGLPEVAAPPPTDALGALRTRLSRPPDTHSTPDTTLLADGTLTLARTPDELRELDELVRAVQSAIVDDAVPLDEIAIVLPDAEHADVLQAALERAGIPATWLIGPSLARAPAASFLSLALEMACAPPTAEQFYELLVQPAFALRANLGPRATAGRGRWRRLLATCGAHRGCEPLVDAMHARLDDAADPDGDRAAVESLTIALRAVQEALDALPERATLPVHGAALHRFLAKWWLSSPDRERTLDVLTRWGQRPLGPELDRAAASALVLETLANTQLLDGNLGAPRVRVLPPMSALGCAARRVFVAGLDEGRFPRPRREHPVLGDDEVRFLFETLGVRLVDSRDHADTERRRLAAALSACTERLWLSWAASDMLEARPRLPGRLLLEVASALLGRRATFADLRQLATPTGSRARPVPDDPERALGPLEHLCARALGDDAQAALEVLATHPVARRLLTLHRAQARLRDREFEPAARFDVHTHHLDPALLETPDDENPTTAEALARLVLSPGDEFLDRQLGARRAPRFYADAGFGRRAQHRTVRALTMALEGAEGTLEQRFVAALDALAQAQGGGEVAQATREAQRAIALETFARWQAAVAPPEQAAPCVLEAPVVPAQLEVALEGGCGHLDDTGTLFELRTGRVTRSRLDERLALVLHALALEAAHRPVTSVTLTSLDGSSASGPLDEWRDAALACTQRILALRRQGRLGAVPDALRLSGDPSVEELGALDDAALAAGDDA